MGYDIKSIKQEFKEKGGRLMKRVLGISDEDVKENLECTNTLRPYVTMLAKVINTCMVKKDVLKFQGIVFRNKKLLPYDGSSVKVLEYADYVAVFTPEGRHITCLYKNRFRSEQSV